MSRPMPKYVDDNHYHLWTDALHGRALAHQAENKWDRATYVRWTIVTAWIVLEVACQDALGQPSISYQFRRYLDSAIQDAGLPPLDWGQGIWQRVTELQEHRKGFVHRFLAEKDLFPEAVAADAAIETVRAAVKDIYQHAVKPVPTWIDDNDDRGWASRGQFGMATLTIIEAGADPNAADTIRVAFVREGEEHTTRFMAPGKDYMVEVEHLRSNIRVPISAIRVYQGAEVLHEETVRMRGAGDA